MEDHIVFWGARPIKMEFYGLYDHTYWNYDINSNQSVGCHHWGAWDFRLVSQYFVMILLLFELLKHNLLAAAKCLKKSTNAVWSLDNSLKTLTLTGGSGTGLWRAGCHGNRVLTGSLHICPSVQKNEMNSSGRVTLQQIWVGFVSTRFACW